LLLQISRARAMVYYQSVAVPIPSRSFMRKLPVPLVDTTSWPKHHPHHCLHSSPAGATSVRWCCSVSVTALVAAACRSMAHRKRRSSRCTLCVQPEPAPELPEAPEEELSFFFASEEEQAKPRPELQEGPEDELTFFLSSEDEDEPSDFVEKLSDFEEVPSKEETAGQDWDTGMDFVPEYDPDFDGDGSTESLSADPPRSVDIEPGSLVKPEVLVGARPKSTEVDMAVGDFALMAKWKQAEGGWSAPEIKICGEVRLCAGAAAIHGGALALQDIWAFKDVDSGMGTALWLLNPAAALQRLSAACLLAGLPSAWHGDKLAKCIEALVAHHAALVPEAPRGAMVIQAAVLGTQLPKQKGVVVSEADLIVVCRPLPAETEWGVPEDIMSAWRGDTEPIRVMVPST